GALREAHDIVNELKRGRRESGGRMRRCSVVLPKGLQKERATGSNRRRPSLGISRSLLSIRQRSVTIQSLCSCLPVSAEGCAERITLESSETPPPAGTCRQPLAAFRNSFRLADAKSVSRRV